MSKGIFVGLDVKRAGLHAAIRPTDQQWSAKMDDSGVTETVNRLASVKPEIVVLEAQGDIELPLAGTLVSEGLPLAFVSRRIVRDFARSIGQIRPDRNHAGLLAHFAELVRPEVKTMPDDIVEQLRALKGRRDDIRAMLDLERNRQRLDYVAVQKDIKNHIYFLERSVVSLTEEINRTVRSSSIWR